MPKQARQGLNNLIIKPAAWRYRNLQVKPWDLSKFAPYGTGVYGFQKNYLAPAKGAPKDEENGGIIYFGNGATRQDFDGFLRMIDVSAENKDYAAFIQESSNPLEDKYFKQMRLVSKFGLRHMFKALDGKEYDSFQKQELTMGEAFWEFMKAEKERYGTCFGDSRIEGKMGGDGHFAREQLSFGFMLENGYYDIYRIWSRAWLVTK